MGECGLRRDARGAERRNVSLVVVLAAVPLVIVHVVVERASARVVDRERTSTRLLRTAEEYHSSVDTDAVTSSLAHSAKELLTRGTPGWAPPPRTLTNVG